MVVVIKVTEIDEEIDRIELYKSHTVDCETLIELYCEFDSDPAFGWFDCKKADVTINLLV